ncbi:histidine kinase-, DNA gyrase b-, and HSP90-like ATPase domain-containing protein [Sarocladium implicatum]|nr:histidine kinase-, DNA gyrase b-, and HSP90-like ATPase domain-containing protein [Sarocladium implicatum]
MAHTLDSLALTDLLDADPRPTFVVALPPDNPRQQGRIAYRNKALSSSEVLLQLVTAAPDSDLHSIFWKWVTTRPSASADLEHTLPYLGALWTKTLIKGDWIVMSANDSPPMPEPPRKKRRLVDAGHVGGLQNSPPERPSVGGRTISEQEAESMAPISIRAETDSEIILPDLSAESELFMDVVQKIDWEATRLGPMNKWPLRLQQAFNQIIPDSRAIAIYWGTHRITVYNEAFSKFCGANHPALLGRDVVQAWPHLKEPLERIWRAPSRDFAKVDDESRFFVDQPDGTSLETYVMWSLAPIMDHRACVGVLHSLLDTTSLRLWERRMKFLIDLGDALVTARDIKSYWALTIGELSRWTPSYDVPLAFVYSVSVDDDSDSARSTYDCPTTCRLEGALGVPKGHPIAPPILNLRDAEHGLSPSFRQALTERHSIVLNLRDGSLPEDLLEGLEPRGFGDPCQAGIVCPIRPNKDGDVMGILFLGLNPRRPYDNDYRQFISLLNQKLASSLASTVLLEEEARRRRTAAQQAEYDRQTLELKLRQQTEQVNLSGQFLLAVAEFLPVGVSFGDLDGNVLYANDAWHRLVPGHEKDAPLPPTALLDSAVLDDRAKIVKAYEDIKTTDAVTFEFRMMDKERRRSDASISNHHVTVDDFTCRHILASAKVERGVKGDVLRVLTCLTEVTAQKRATEEALRRAQEAENLKRLAEFATVGMYDMSLDGHLISANNLFWELSGLQKVDLTQVSVDDPWKTCVLEEDLPLLWKALDKLKRKGKPETAEVRFKSTYVLNAEDANGDLIEAPRSVLATFMPVKSSDGVIQSFTGCLSDVSLQRWQLEQERHRKDEAIDSKRQQENFIDMTSHEMRNPLSAILNLSDAIIASLLRVQEFHEHPLPPTPGQTSLPESISTSRERTEEERTLLRDSIENAETIVTCAQHQKRIVDDILTMSKLDSKLLTVTPCTINPVEIVLDAVKMFEVEARRVDIALTSTVHQSYHDLGKRFLDLDPSRVKQILINLLTNALKFTKTGKTRVVTIALKGSTQRPTRELTQVDFLHRFSDPVDEYEQPALKGRGEPIYLLFEVSDTGQGLTDKEMGTLFNKFVQASAKTHVKYGGSGLGLFISRRLTELQNGAIGVISKPGVGTTFSFYVESYVPSDRALREAEATAAAAELVHRNAQGSDSSNHASSASRSQDRLLARLHRAGNVRIDGILVVEDNLINQKITHRGLTERGYAVAVANHGVEALEMLRARMGSNRGNPDSSSTPNKSTTNYTPINLVLMDIEMPVQDGLTCTRRIRELEREGEIFSAAGGRIPIIAVTANARSEQVVEAKQAGCDDVLVKPYRIPELVEKMHVVVRRLGGLSPNSPVLG